MQAILDNIDAGYKAGLEKAHNTRSQLIAKRWIETTPMNIAEAAIKSTNCTDSAIDMAVLAEDYKLQCAKLRLWEPIIARIAEKG